MSVNLATLAGTRTRAAAAPENVAGIENLTGTAFNDY